MIQITLQTIPNQSFTLQLNDNSIDIRLHTCGTFNNQMTSVTIAINSVIIVSNIRAVAEYPIIPYAYLEQGNFAFFTMRGELPIWQQFGISQQLIYATPDEINALNAPASITNATA